MKKSFGILVYISITMVVWLLPSCSKETRLDERIAVEEMPTNDPFVFELGRCQSIYNSFLRENGLDTKGYVPLEATHYVIKVYPRSFTQQVSIECDTSLVFSYFPFGEHPDEPVPEHSSNSIRPNPSFEQKVCCISEDNSLLENKHVSCLYVLWPAERTIPEDLNFELCYEVFDPYCSHMPADIKNEIISRIVGDPFPNFPQIPDAYVTVRVYDSLLGQYVPLKNIAVKADYGSIIKTYVTDSLGTVCIPRKYGETAYCTYLMNQDHFSVRDSVTSAIVERVLGSINIGDPFLMIDTYYTFNRSESFYETIYQAADYFFNENQHGASDIAQLNHIPIYGEPAIPQYLGLYSSFGYISIYDSYSMQYVIGTTLHELGHYYQHRNRTGLTLFSLPDIFVESFASCNGYYLGTQYYLSKGYNIPYPSFSLTGQERQYWTPSLSIPYLNYSPIFVDLIDSYNQYVAGQQFPNDELAGCVFDIILQMAKEADDLEDIRDILITAFDGIYTTSQIDAQLSYYTGLF